MEEQALKLQYDKNYKSYITIAKIVKEKLEYHLNKEGILFDSIPTRVKKYSSFLDKVNNEGYTDPFNQIKDLCGIRLIHLFDNDLDKIKKVISKIFKTKTFHDKTSETIKNKTFHYRSYHMYIYLKEEDCKKNGKNENFIAEIQIRTICMHAWAEVEHKLNYKNKTDLPEKTKILFLRKFSQMSAILEIADDIFHVIRESKKENIKKYGIKVKALQKEGKELKELNVDSLEAFLLNYFPNTQQDNQRIKYLLNEMNDANISLSNFDIAYKNAKKHKLLQHLKDNYPTLNNTPTRTGLSRLILEIFNEDFYFLRIKKNRSEKWKNFIELERKNNNEK